MKMENLKGGFKVLIVIIAVLAIAATSFWYTYSKTTTDLRKTLETVKPCRIRQHGSHVYSGQSNRHTHKSKGN